MKEMFKQIPTTTTKPLIPKQKVQKLMTEIGGGWYMKQISKGITSLRRPKLSKYHKIRKMKFKIYIYEDNKWWNSCELQLHCHKLEWVNPRSKF